MSPRIRAFCIHLLASATLASLSLALVLLVWYPAPLHQALAVTHIFFILMGVDVVVGPLLTLLVFKPGKKYLRQDLSIIVLLQISAFSYGMWTLAEGRPAWLVFNKDRFDLVKVYEIDPRHLEQTKPEFRSAPWAGPRWIAARPPEDLEARNTLLFESATTGIDIPQRPDLYCPLEEEIPQIRSRARALDELNQFNPPEAVKTVLERWPEADAWLPMNSTNDSLTVLLKKETGQVVALVALQPWK